MRDVRGGSLRLYIVIKEYRFLVMNLVEMKYKGIFWNMTTYPQFLNGFLVAEHYQFSSCIETAL